MKTQRAKLIEKEADILNRILARAERNEADKTRIDWLQNKALGASVDATLDDLIGKGWTDLRSAIDKAK